MAEPILAVERLSTGYGDFQALFDVDLALEEGEVLALVGANGAGKSTTFRAILGLLPSAPGMIRHRGRPIGGTATNDIVHRGIAMVAEGRRLFRSLNVEENLLLARDYGRLGHWTLDLIYQLFPVLKERRRTLATQLSGGQQQMVAIGRALIANPEIILFDEISLGLAPVIVNDVYTALPKIIDAGVSAILVEQDVVRAQKLAGAVVCLREGRSVLSGPAASFDKHQITAAYFGE